MHGQYRGCLIFGSNRYEGGIGSNESGVDRVQEVVVAGVIKDLNSFITPIMLIEC